MFPVEPQSEVERLQHELQVARRQAALGLAVASMAHEVNNLLTPVLTYAQMALRQPENHALVEKALVRSSEGVQRASRISQSILRLARAQEESGEVATPHCDVASACMQALDSVMLGLQREDIQVRVEIEPDLSAAIDAIELEHVLLNMLLNAQKALGRLPGKRQVQVRGWRGSSTGNTGRGGAAAASQATTSPTATIFVEVRDNGPGISKDLLDRLFEPFATSPHHGAAPGHGLGLMLCRHLIEQAGGRVVGENVAGGGAVFRIELPAGQVQQSPRQAA